MANRIADGKFKLDGKEYQLAQVIIIINIITIIIIIIVITTISMELELLSDIFQNNGPNALHGGLVGLDKVV